MDGKRGIKVFTGIVGVCVLFAGIGIGLVVWDIHKSVQENIAIAQSSHPVESDDVASLIAYVNSAKHSLGAKNHAVWTLGRISDSRAVESLKSNLTGAECDHTEHLCQREIRRAIKRCTVF
jgi:hypothetical protein